MQHKYNFKPGDDGQIPIEERSDSALIRLLTRTQFRARKQTEVIIAVHAMRNLLIASGYRIILTGQRAINGQDEWIVGVRKGALAQEGTATTSERAFLIAAAKLKLEESALLEATPSDG